MTTSTRNAAAAIRRLTIEYKQLTTDPNTLFPAVGPISEDNYLEWEALLPGPDDTPFEGGVFSARLSFRMYITITHKSTYIPLRAADHAIRSAYFSPKWCVCVHNPKLLSLSLLPLLLSSPPPFLPLPFSLLLFLLSLSPLLLLLLLLPFYPFYLPLSFPPLNSSSLFLLSLPSPFSLPLLPPLLSPSIPLPPRSIYIPLFLSFSSFFSLSPLIFLSILLSLFLSFPLPSSLSPTLVSSFPPDSPSLSVLFPSFYSLSSLCISISMPPFLSFSMSLPPFLSIFPFSPFPPSVCPFFLLPPPLSLSPFLSLPIFVLVCIFFFLSVCICVHLSSSVYPCVSSCLSFLLSFLSLPSPFSCSLPPFLFHYSSLPLLSPFFAPFFLSSPLLIFLSPSPPDSPFPCPLLSLFLLLSSLSVSICTCHSQITHSLTHTLSISLVTIAFTFSSYIPLFSLPFFLFLPSFPLFLLIPSPSALSSFLFSSLLSLASFRLRLISLSSPPTSSLVYLILSSFLPHFLLSSPFLFLFFSSLSSLLFPFPCLCPRVSRSLSLSLSLYFHVPLFFLLFPYSPSRSPDLFPSVLPTPLSPLFPSLLPLLLSLLPFSFHSFPFPHVYLLFLLSLFRCSVCLSFFLRSSPSPSPFLLFYASSSCSLLFRLLYFLPSPLPFFLSSPLLSLL